MTSVVTRRCIHSQPPCRNCPNPQQQYITGLPSEDTRSPNPQAPRFPISQGLPRPPTPSVRIELGLASGGFQRPSTSSRLPAHDVDSDEESTDRDPNVRQRHVQALGKTLAVSQTLETSKPQAAAQQRHNEVIGLLNVLTAKMDGMQEQIRAVQTDVKILKESVGKVGSIGPSSGVYTKPHY
uniref:Uncharacterized protein n=1 Tax=Blattella germanica chuvirus 1 TaxID=3133478 RepID=A0AAT9JF24_9VIRU